MLIGLLLPVFFILPARAQALTLNIAVNQAKLNFPDSIQFVLSSTSPTTIQKVSLIYGTSAESCVSSSARQEVDFKASNTVNANWTWDLSQSGDLPPGASVWWQWEVQDDTGGTFTSAAKQLTIQDPNFSWQKLQQGVLTVYWSRGNAAFGKMIMDVGVSSLDRLTKSAGIQPPDQIQLTIYPNSDAMKNAAPFLPEWTGGVAFSEYNSVLIGIAPGQDSWAAQAIPHELAHLVTNKRTYNCLGNSMPTWLNEGLSVFNQGPTSQTDKDLVLQALKNDRLPPLASLANGFAATTKLADLDYAESGMLVSYMIESLGANKMDTLLGTIQQGHAADTALQEVFGLDTKALDLTWRSSLGYGVAPNPSVFKASATVQTTAIPTLALWSPLTTPSTTPAPVITPAAQNTQIVQPTLPPSTSSEPVASPFWLYVGFSVIVILSIIMILILIYVYKILK